MSCATCAEIPASVHHRWRDPDEETLELPAAVKALRTVAGWDVGGRGEKLLRCDGCGASFHWTAQFEILTSGCDNDEGIERVTAERAAQIEAALPADGKLPG